MRDDLSQLLILQNRDSEILALRKEIDRIPTDRERARDRLAKDQQNLADAKDARRQNEMAINQVELDIGTRRQSIDRLKNQQFETRKNEEFRAFGSEIERYEGLVDELETRELELMEKADELMQRIADAETALAKTEESVDEDLAALDERDKQCHARLDELLAEREKIIPQIEGELLSTYDRLFKIKKSLAVCAVSETRQCEGCHVKLTPGTYSKMMAGKKITQCNNCGRIVHAA